MRSHLLIDLCRRLRLLLVVICLFSSATLWAETVVDIEVKGNAKVEPEAIVALLETRVGREFEPRKIQADIRALFELGYFSDVRVFREVRDGGIKLVFQVVEKPAIVAIEFEGFEEVSSDDFKDKLETRLFTIVNEATIARDLRHIERQYAEKGFFLASATYLLDVRGENEVALKYVVTEGSKVQIGGVEILGNQFFTDAELIDKLMTKPLTRASNLSSIGSMYNEDFINRDLEFLSYYYRDFGFAKVKVAKPIIELDQDRRFARVTFQIEEGQQFRVSSIDIQGDVLIPKEELLEKMRVKPGELFRFSQFRADIEMLIDQYGDLGYAFADVDPRTPFNDEERTVALTYHVTKGEKVYIGNISISGNVKTRDNVIRREIEIADTDLYSGTKLRRSKANIERLGFFEEVQSIKHRSPGQSNVLDYQFRIKERSTGQLQAALGFQPYGQTAGSSWFGQGRYNEENQSGYGWRTSLSGRWDGKETYDLSLDFMNPRVDDSQWSLGLSIFLRNEFVRISQNVDVTDRRTGASITLGRFLYEELRGSVTYRITDVEQKSDAFLPPRFRQDGLASSVIFGLRRNKTNNFIDPNEGTDVSVTQNFTGGPFGGDLQFMESRFTGSWFLPIDFTDGYRTHFRFHNTTSALFPMGDQPVPLFERYRLGGPINMRGYEINSLGPHVYYLNHPGGEAVPFNKGGDKQTFFQFEYFAPLIPEAGIRLVLFADVGRVFDDHEPLSLSNFNKNVGFGFRWITPLAPFRFEWAYPVEDGKLGDQRFILFLGF
jgi:outer membrane protein insertion porin family